MNRKLLLFAALLLLCQPADARSAKSARKDLSRMTGIEKEMRLKSIALLSVIKKMGPLEESVSIDKVKLLGGGCSVYESMDTGSRPIFSPRINDEFILLGREDEFYRIQLPDGREGWIPESCVQTFTEDREVKSLSYEGLGTGEVNRYMSVASELYHIIEREKIKADKIAAGYLDESGKPRSKSPGPEEADILISYKNIRKYSRYASFFYNKYIEGFTPISSERAGGLEFSGWGEFLFGSSDFTTKRENQDDIREDGSTSNISLGGNLSISENSRLRLGFSRKNEILQTPFTSTDFNLTHSYRPENGIGFDTRLRFRRYSDELNEFNDYRRLSVGGRANLVTTPARRVYVDYTLMNNKYSENDDDDYLSNRIRAEARFKSGSSTDYVLALNSNLETSDAAFHKFTYLLPSFSYIRHGKGGSTALKASYQMLSYSDAELKSYNKPALRLTSESFSGGSRKTRMLGVFYKQFPDNDLSTYIQGRGRYAASRTGLTSRRLSAAFYTNIFTENSDASFTDLRLDAGGSNRKIYGSLSTFFKFWHSAGEDTDSTVVKPHVLDIYGKLGFIVRNIRIGPTFGVHTLIADGRDFLKDEGDVLRIGGSAEGTFSLPNRISVSFSVLYENGFVYNSEILSVDSFGNVEYGETVQRHPTTFQANLSVQAPITDALELSLRLNTYKVKTDMDDTISRDPVTENNRFSIFAGLRYRYN
ncbi:MAG: hypothetical protein GF417_09320 [Candidatus Latescibacteria bacterium]|nr:hypothetical protein [bacterium]MBD3424624.1 hypothetical protein [Candidatus Latescibacterota bacterium]